MLKKQIFPYSNNNYQNEIVMKFVLRNDKTTTKDILVRNQKSSGKSLQVFVIVYKAFSIAIKVL